MSSSPLKIAKRPFLLVVLLVNSKENKKSLVRACTTV